MTVEDVGSRECKCVCGDPREVREKGGERGSEMKRTRWEEIGKEGQQI